MLVGLAVTVVAVLGVGLTAGDRTPSPAATAQQQGGEPVGWDEVDRLVSEQKMQAALDMVEEILAAARQAGDAAEWTRALVEATKLRLALHGYETAVRFLAGAEWPADPTSRAVLDLYQANALVTYARMYSWEIRQRERVVSDDEVDLKRWTTEQIAAAANRAFQRVWDDRGEWGAEPIGELSRYLQQNDYPPRIRGTLRDAVTYMWVELLDDTSLWRPGQTAEVYRLDLGRLLAGEPGEAPDLSDPRLHPLVRIAFLTGDLERWHAASGRAEAALEATLERLRRVDGHLQRDEDHAAVRSFLAARLAELDRSLEWWAAGQAELARMTMASDPAPDAFVRARAIALAGMKRHPGSIGGRRCHHVVAQIEQPSYGVAMTASDAPGRRSIRVTHANLEQLFFRAYSYDLEQQVESGQDRNLLPSWQEIPGWLTGREPDASWSVDLPPTPDYRQHATDVTPPMTRPGAYVVIASARSDFGVEGNQLQAIHLVLGEPVLLVRELDDAWEVTVRAGSSGEAAAGATVSLWQLDWRRGHHLQTSATTAGDGRATIAYPPRGRSGQFVLLARWQGQLAVDPDTFWPRWHDPRGTSSSVFLFSDRSVYRPGQTVHVKAVVYEGGGEEVEYRLVPDRQVTIRLRDANNEIVAQQEVATNGYGSADTSFEIPPGRLLGQWRLDSDLGGGSAIRVEEYKRPTFEVELEPPADQLRLNRPAELAGTARYYFGLPVTEGAVRWWVTREPVWPAWWGWWRPRPASQPVIVAGGDVELDADGRFTARFTPEADEREASNGVSYRFKLSAEVTDAAGETRSATRVVRLGFVTVELALSSPAGFVDGAAPAPVGVRRADLDGNPRAGDSRWRLVRLAQPERTGPPSEQPLPPVDDDRYQTEGDRRRPRAGAAYDPDQVMALWPAGVEVATGELSHGDDGAATLALPRLAAGAYRLELTTEDPFGAEATAREQLVVVRDGNAELALPALLRAAETSVAVGGTVRLLAHSGFADQPMVLELYRDGRRFERRLLRGGGAGAVVEIPVTADLRGGFGATLSVLHDHQLVVQSTQVMVPWDDRRLEVAFATFRDRMRPGTTESFRVSVKGADGEPLGAGTAELLAYMYDRSLDLFAPHNPPDPISLYPVRSALQTPRASLGAGRQLWSDGRGLGSIPGWPSLSGDRLKLLDGYGVGGPGTRMMQVRSLGHVAEGRAMAPMAAKAEEGDRIVAYDEVAPAARQKADNAEAPIADAVPTSPEPPADQVRSNFAETALWLPHLVTDADGGVSFEVTAPDSVTDWQLWVHALTRDVRAGRVNATVATVKDLMVRPAVPRFLREGDRAELAVTVDNAGETPLEGTLELTVQDPASGDDLAAAFDLRDATGVPFAVEPGRSQTLRFPIAVPPRPGIVAFRAVARAGDLSDGELRPLPVLPGRMHLVQSKFAALRDADWRELTFADMAADDDPSRIDDRLVVTVDAQLFAGVLAAMPYLVDYPYECTEQTLNRFLSTGIVASVMDEYPAVAKLAAQLAAQRDSQYEQWEADDPNRSMLLEETPWLALSRGGDSDPEQLLKVLDPDVARAVRSASLKKLGDAQTSLGGFPWWPGGPPSPHMTLYIAAGLSKALEFGVEVPRPMVQRAFAYLHRWYLDDVVDDMMAHDCCWELVTYLEWVLSNYPDDSWTGGVFSADDRQRMRDFSFRHWREHSPMLKGYLALVLERADRHDDAVLVWDAVMDSAKTDPDLGTYWAPEDRAWLWYNDTTETHALALRVLTELEPADPRREGLVQWLFLDKQLGHWKSTRATAEVIYSLVHYLEHEHQLGIREAVSVVVGPRRETFTFEPDEFRGPARLVIPGPQIEPRAMATTVVSKQTPGIAFASATWAYSTERLPEEARGDLFEVHRSYFKRSRQGDEFVLEPLEPGDALAIGDQLEVHLSLRARHAAEYVHVRDPRAAGVEPERLTSGWRWDLGISAYEEVRDSGTNFFVDWLPAGEYTLTYRLRVAMAGTFKVAPATLQSMYAPEFAAFSAGNVLEVR